MKLLTVIHQRLCQLAGCAGLILLSIMQGWTEEAPTPVLDRWLAQQAHVTSWSAEFLQVRRLKALTQPLQSPGHVWFAAPDRFRWELGNPPQSIAVRQADTLVILSPRLQRAERFSLEAAAHGPMKEALALLDTGFPRDAAEFRRRFEVLRLESSSNALTHRLHLQPREASARKLLPSVIIGLREPRLELIQTTLRLADGSELETTFTNALLNAAVDPTRFDPQPPTGYTVIETKPSDRRTKTSPPSP